MSRLAAARAVGIEVAARHADDVDTKARFPREAISALKDAKLLGLLVPRSLDGPGASLAEGVAICHELGRHCASTAMIYAMHQIQVWCIARHAGDSAWHGTFLGRLAAEQLLLASATSEAGIGGDVRSSLCAVEQHDDRLSLVKEASVISYGADSDCILVTARRTPQSPASDQVIVVAPRSCCTLEQLGSWDTLGMRGTCSNSYRLTVEGTIAQIVPAHYADVSAQTMLPTSHLVWSAVWLGIATDAVRRARAFVRAETRRRPDGMPARDRRLVQANSLLQQMKSTLIASLRDYEAALGNEDAVSSLGFAVGMNNLKLACSQLAVRIVEHALLVCGLEGYRNDSAYSVGRHLRDAYSAVLMVNNDRIAANTARLLPALHDDRELLA